VESRVRSQFSCGSVASEEIWSCFIESLLIGLKVDALKFIMSGLEIIFFDKASYSNFAV
jgi:hypothetical protein